MFKTRIFTAILQVKSIKVQIFRHHNFISHEKRKNSIDFLRKVLKSRNDCFLYDPVNRSCNFAKNDEIIKELVELGHKFRNRTLKVNFQFSRTHLPPLDVKCLKKSTEWSTDQKLFVMDVWHSFFRQGHLDFFRKTLNDFLNEMETLPNGSTLQVLYYVAGSKKRLKQHEERNIIQAMGRVLDHSTLEEISIYCSALVIGEAKSRKEYSITVKSLFNYLSKVKDFKQNESAVLNIIKAVRHLSLVDHIKDIQAAQIQSLPLAEVAEMYTLTHIALLGFQQRVHNPQLLEIIMRRFMENIDKLRLKEIERMLLIISTFQIERSDGLEKRFCKMIQETLKNSYETDFPSSLISCISYLIDMGIVDDELIDWALRYADQKLKNFVSQDDINRLLNIDSFAKINLAKTYEGHRLPENLCAEMKTKAFEHLSDGFQSRLMKDLGNIFQKNNHQYVLHKAAPHFLSSDLIFLYNKRMRKTVKISNSRKLKNTILYASDIQRNDPELMAVVIVPCMQRNKLFNSHIYVGPFQRKLNQLKLLGYETIVLPIAMNKWLSMDDINMKREQLHSNLIKRHIFLFD